MKIEPPFNIKKTQSKKCGGARGYFVECTENIQYVYLENFKEHFTKLCNICRKNLNSADSQTVDKTDVRFILDHRM